MLELALWKSKIDEWKIVQNKEEQIDEEGWCNRHRHSCRINSGADVVISNVLPFLDKVCSDD
jgi:hypothetical protein